MQTQQSRNIFRIQEREKDSNFTHPLDFYIIKNAFHLMAFWKKNTFIHRIFTNTRAEPKTILFNNHNNKILVLPQIFFLYNIQKYSDSYQN